MSDDSRPKHTPMRGDLTQGPIPRTLLLFSIPALLTNVLQSVADQQLEEVLDFFGGADPSRRGRLDRVRRGRPRHRPRAHPAARVGALGL